MMNKYGSLVIEKKDDDNNEQLDDDNTLQMDRESQQLLSVVARDTIDDESSFDHVAATTTTTGNAIISNNRKGRIAAVLLVGLFVTIFAVVGSGFGSSSTIRLYNFFGDNDSVNNDNNTNNNIDHNEVVETMVISATTAGDDATTSSYSSFTNNNVEEVGNNEVKDEEDNLSSPFFTVVLPWKQEQMSDSSEDVGDGDDSNSNDSSSSTTTMSNHYKGVIEFCSDPEKGLYGYGLLGECVPGQPTPLIRMKPKHFYQLTLVNNGHIATNLHTHGLHVSGVGTVDDVTRRVEPGNCLTYDYYILDDADVGTYWYHPHWHPLVTRTAYGGAYGMLIVDETVDEYYPTHIENFLKPSNEVLLQFSSMYNKKLPNPIRSNKVNGQQKLDLTIQPDTYYHFRVSSVVYAESVNYVEFIPHDACDVRPIAYDGVYRSEIPHPVSSSKHMMTVSSRVDLSVRCSEDAEIYFHQGKGLSDESKMVEIHVSSLSSSSSTDNDPSDVTLSSPDDHQHSSSPYWDMDLETSWKPRRPYYMPDLADPINKVDEKWYISMDDYFVNGTKGVSVNQHTWDPNSAIRTFDLGQLIEFPIMLSQSHPFHAHINRMQIVEPGGCGGRFEEGEYFDTIVQSTDKKECNVRTKFFDFAGRIVIHCHRFGHEDQGMMTWIDVLGGHGHGMNGAPQTNCSAVL